MPRPITSLHHPVAVDRQRGEMAVERDYAAHVAQMIRQVLLTAPGERVMRPEFGCGLRQMVFAPNDPATAGLLRVTVQQALERWLGSVIAVDQIDIVAEGETLVVRLRYVLLAAGDQRTLDVAVGV